jgi:hypothetical protein
MRERETAAYSIKELVYAYQSIDMHCIVLPVKFDGGLSILVLRNKQLYFLKKKRSKGLTFFKPRHLEKDPLGKVSLFGISFFLHGLDNTP